MRVLKNKKGTTLAELLMVSAIMAILAGLGFVLAMTYIKNLRLNEMDGIAKEIFIAAQNQLTKASASGELSQLDLDDAGVKQGDVYYIIHNPTNTIGESAMELILPFGSVDQAVLDKSFILGFDPATGIVVQVYYSDNYSFTEADLTETLIAGIESRNQRKNYNGKIIGYYHGDDAGLALRSVRTPSLSVVNGNLLTAEITVYDDDIRTLVCLRGQTSGAEKTIDKSVDLDAAGSSITIILDDITSSNHFANITSEGIIPSGKPTFIPGEDIEIFVTCQASDGSLSNVAESKHVIENTLFGSIRQNEDGSTIAQIKNVRHFENLDPSISGVSYSQVPDEPVETALYITSAEQLSDFSWSSFDLNTTDVIRTLSGVESAPADTFMPVNINLDFNFEYDGKNRYIDGVVVDSTLRHGGLFGLISNMTIKNLELHNFNIKENTETFSSGALAGTATNVVVENVLAFNPSYPEEEDYETYSERERLLKITAPASAGGLIGTASNCNLSNSAASVYVVSSGSAGGFIGNITGSSVSSCYSGGHTVGGVYLIEDSAETNAIGRPNVVGSKAGGLIGSVASTSISNCYSTASVKGSNIDNTDPLFVGTATSSTNCYGAGLICLADKEGTDYRLPPRIDESKFLSADMQKATAYDLFHKEDYYLYKTTAQLTGTESTVWFMNSHVGDWALPGYTTNIFNN